MITTYISAELKRNLKAGKINKDASNLRELMLSTKLGEPDEDLFIPENQLLKDLDVSTFSNRKTIHVLMYTICVVYYLLELKIVLHLFLKFITFVHVNLPAIRISLI